ncbi:unnamed protein product [Rhizophagus irregularis]|nr:unnamed protein product [Rhizophagus irregularis]
MSNHQTSKLAMFFVDPVKPLNYSYALKAGGSWLTKERQKFENFTEEKFQSFSADCQQESKNLFVDPGLR